jgi:hypothetical protein
MYDYDISIHSEEHLTLEAIDFLVSISELPTFDSLSKLLVGGRKVSSVGRLESVLKSLALKGFLESDSGLVDPQVNLTQSLTNTGRGALEECRARIQSLSAPKFPRSELNDFRASTLTTDLANSDDLNRAGSSAAYALPSLFKHLPPKKHRGAKDRVLPADLTTLDYDD